MLVFDVSSGVPLAQRELTVRPELLSFSAGGDELLVYGQPRGETPGLTQPGVPRVLALDAATLDTGWEHALDQVLSGTWCSASCEAEHNEQQYTAWTPAVAPAPDRGALYVVHADAERLTTVDWNERTVRTAELGQSASWFERLLRATAGVASAKGTQTGAYKQAVLSPDGARLYVTGEAYQPGDDGVMDATSLGLQVFDIASKQRLAQHQGDAARLRLAPDGAHVLLLEHWSATPAIEVLDNTNLERVAYIEQWEIHATRRLDGTPLVVGKRTGQGNTELALLDPLTFAVLDTWSTDSRSSWVVPIDGWP